MSDTQGATANERLLAAARADNEDMLLKVFDEGGFDINHQDGQGNTALHYAASYGSTDVLEHILSHEECDVDPVNSTEKATPLHLAVRIDDEETRQYVVESLLDAGANAKLTDKSGLTALDYVKNDEEIGKLFRRAEAMDAIDPNDIVDDESDESGSDEEDED